jgi:hypothetical protein
LKEPSNFCPKISLIFITYHIIKLNCIKITSILFPYLLFSKLTMPKVAHDFAILASDLCHRPPQAGTEPALCQRAKGIGQAPEREGGPRVGVVHWPLGRTLTTGGQVDPTPTGQGQLRASMGRGGINIYVKLRQ